MLGEVDEEVTVPSSQVDRLERVIFLAEPGAFVHVGRSDEPALEVVGPGVVRALDALADAGFGLGEQAGPPVPADVIEGANLVVLAPDDDQALVGDLAEDGIAGIGDLVLAADEDPHPGEEPFALLEEVIRVDVIAGRQGPGVERQGVPGASLPSPNLRSSSIPIASTGHSSIAERQAASSSGVVGWL